MPHRAPRVETTGIDGVGAWDTLCRGFQSKIQALFDIVDNGLDATVQEGIDSTGFIGKLHIYPDEHKVQNNMKTTGLCIINNSIKKIIPLKDILTVFKSSKRGVSDKDKVGENGVGLKQACAVLSDRSFVMVKEGIGADTTIQLGIIAQDLQKKEGVYLPSFEFSLNTGASLKDQMLDLFNKPRYAGVKNCIAAYGKVSHASDPNFLVGVERLCRHANAMCTNYSTNPYVFLVVLDKIHAQQDYVESNAVGLDASMSKAVHGLIKELETELPKTYLHIPDDFDFLVCGKKMEFKYWPSRLVELSSFTVDINKKIPWQHNLNQQHQQDAYKLRVFFGFDVTRVTETRKKKQAVLLFHSRMVGRLIETKEDARSILGLWGTSSDYCQGLTIIVDDLGGHLTLSPTKEKLSFGHERYGKVHEENLYAQVGSAAHCFYEIHFKKFGKKKFPLSKAIASFGDNLVTGNLKSLVDSDLTTYEYTSKKSAEDKIRVDTRKPIKTILGKDTLYRLKAAPKSKRTERKRKATNEGTQASEEAQGPRRKKPVSYAELTSGSESEKDETEDDNRKLPARRAVSRDSELSAELADVKRRLQEAQTENNNLRRDNGELRRKLTTETNNLANAKITKNDMTKQLTAAQAEKDDLTKQLTAAHTEKEDLRRQLSATNEELATANDNFNTANAGKEDLVNRLLAANEEIGDLKKKLASAIGTLKDVMATKEEKERADEAARKVCSAYDGENI